MKKEDINTSFDLDYKDEVDQKEYLQTKCKDCVFEILPKQCDFNIPNNINENKLILVKEEDNQDHYRINGFCKNFRPEIWKTANKGEDLVAVLEKDDSLDHLEVLSIIRKQGDRTSFPLFLTTFFFTDILENDFKLIDSAFDHIKSGHYSVFETGRKIPENWCSSINDAINKYGKSICYIRPIEGYIHGLTCQTMMHSFLYGHNGASLEQKIREGLEYDKNDTQMIFDWEEINELT